MKFIFKTFLVSGLSMMLIFAGCKKDSSDSNSPAEGQIAAKVDGTNWKAETTNITATYDGGVISIIAIEASGKVLSFDIEAGAPGTYALSAATGNTGIYQDSLTGDDFTSDFSPTAGKFILTEFDIANKKMSGSFEFDGYSFSISGLDSVSVTEGSFKKVAFTTTAGSAFITATVDGVTYNCVNITATENVTALGIEIRGSLSASSYPKIALVLPSGIAPGTYSISQGFDPYYLTSSTGSIPELTGSITITQHNLSTGFISGTFNYTAQAFGGVGPIYTITNGSFAATYP